MNSGMQRPRLRLVRTASGTVVLVCCLFFAIFTSLVGYWLVQTRQFYLDQAMGTMEGLTSTYKAYTEKAVNEIDFSLQLVQGYARQQGALGPRLMQAVAPVLELRRKHTPYVSNLIIVDARGVVVSATAAATTTIGTDVTDREFFAAHRARPDAGYHVGPVISSRLNPDELRFTISRRLGGARGEFLGAVVALVNAQLLGQDYALHLDDSSVSVTLMRLDGMVLSRTPYLKEQIGQILPSFARYKGDPPQRSSFVIKSQIDQVTRLIAQRRFDGMPMLIAVTQLQEAALTRWSASVPVAVGIWGLVLLTTVAAGALVLHQGRRREEVQLELRHSVEALNEAQRIAKVGHMDHDLGSGQVRWSDQIYQLLEVDRKRVIPSVEACHEQVHPQDRQMLAHACGQSSALQQPYEVTYRLCMPDGRIKWVNESCTFEYDRASRPVRAVITLQDISVRKQAEEALVRLNSELEERVTQRTQLLQKARDEAERANRAPIGIPVRHEP